MVCCILISVSSVGFCLTFGIQIYSYETLMEAIFDHFGKKGIKILCKYILCLPFQSCPCAAGSLNYPEERGEGRFRPVPVH